MTLFFYQGEKEKLCNLQRSEFLVALKSADGQVSITVMLTILQNNIKTLKLCSLSQFFLTESKDDDLKMPEYDEETKAKISGNNIGSNTCSSFIQRIKKVKIK